MARSTRARNRKRRGHAAVKANQQPREMTKADICNVELLSESDKRYLSGADQLAYNVAEQARIAEVDRINEALRGLLQVNPYDPDRTSSAQGYVNAQDARYYEDGYPPVEYNLEWASHVSECDGDVLRTLLHHLRWNIAEHQKLLDETVKRLQNANLLGFDDDGTLRYSLAEGGAK